MGPLVFWLCPRLFILAWQVQVLWRLFEILGVEQHNHIKWRRLWKLTCMSTTDLHKLGCLLPLQFWVPESGKSLHLGSLYYGPEVVVVEKLPISIYTLSKWIYIYIYMSFGTSLQNIGSYKFEWLLSLENRWTWP